jgi:hypothetical protein
MRASGISQAAAEMESGTIVRCIPIRHQQVADHPHSTPTAAATWPGYILSTLRPFVLFVMCSTLLFPASAFAQLAVSGGGTGATTLSGYLIGHGTSAITGSATIPATVSTFTQVGTGALARTLDDKAKENALSLLDFCSDNTGATDCASGIANWVAEGLALHKALYIPAGTYRSASQQSWNLHSSSPADHSGNGINVFGDGRAASIIKFDSGVSSPAWQIVGNDTPGEILIYSRFEDFQVLGDTAGTLMAFGRDDFNDALNEFQLNNLLIYNKSTSGFNVALKLNYFLNGLVNVVADGGGYDVGTSTGTGYAALYCRACNFNTFMGSYGNTGNAIYLTYSYNLGNTFLNVDTEASTTDIQIDSSLAKSNTWIGGQISLAAYGINATAGSGNKFINVNNGGSIGTSFMPNSTGVWLETPNINNVSTPGVPSSTTAQSNNTAQKVMVAVKGGTVSDVKRNSTSVFGQSNVTVILEPGDTITLTYSAAPTWTWTPIR